MIGAELKRAEYGIADSETTAVSRSRSGRRASRSDNPGNTSYREEVFKMNKTMSNYEDWAKVRLTEKRQYRFIYGVFFFFFFWISLWSRLLPRSLRPLASSTDDGESVWREASRAAQTAAGFAFMM